MITIAWGWRAAFIITGAIGFIWLVAWLLLSTPGRASFAFKGGARIHSERSSGSGSSHSVGTATAPSANVGFLDREIHDGSDLVGIPFWLPDFLHKRHGLSLKDFGPPLVVVYLMADIGSIGGGWLSSSLIKRGWTINAGRKIAMLICALAVVPIVFAAQTSNLWIAVVLIGLAAAAHQGWSCNLFTTTSDMFPRRAVGSVVGIGGMAGAVGGMMIARVVGEILERTGSYVPIFIIAASAYLVALLLFHLLSPKLDPANL